MEKEEKTLVAEETEETSSFPQGELTKEVKLSQLEKPISPLPGTSEEGLEKLPVTITTREAAIFLHYHKKVIQVMCAQGIIHCRRTGRHWVIPLMEFVEDFRAGRLKPDWRRKEVKAEKGTKITTASGKEVKVIKGKDKGIKGGKEEEKGKEGVKPTSPKEEKEEFYGLPSLLDKDPFEEEK